MDAKSLLELADRVEKATGVDRELWFDVARAAGYRDVHGDGLLWDRGNDGYWLPDNSISPGLMQLPEFLTSLDAAMSLILSGFKPLIDLTTERAIVEIYPPDFDPRDWHLKPTFSGASTIIEGKLGEAAARAIVAACLKALASKGKADD
jgi:hypothetical protein